MMPRKKISMPNVTMMIMMTGWPIMCCSTTRSISMPSQNIMASASGIAAHIGRPSPAEIAQVAYPPVIAMAPCAKLATPEVL